MKNIKINIIPFLTVLAFPFIAMAAQAVEVKSIEVVSISNINGHVKVGIIKSSNVNKIYFGSGLGGYDPENSAPTGTNTEDLAMESVMAIRSLCNQADSESAWDAIEQQLASGQNILLDLNVFSNTDQACLRERIQK